MRTPGNPFHLKAAKRAVTLAGGTEGSNQAAEQPSLFPQQERRALMVKEAHAALARMCGGYLSGRRKQLDHGFDDLVELLEVMRDEIPKVESP